MNSKMMLKHMQKDYPTLEITHSNRIKVGLAMKALGFKRHRSHGRRGYRLVAYKPEEIEMNRRTLAYDARPESEAIASDSEEGDRGDT